MSFLRERGFTVQHACKFTGTARSVHYYKPTPRQPKPLDDGLRSLVRAIATERPSFGYRRVTAMVRRRLGKDKPVNEKAVRRILKHDNLALEPCVPDPERVPKDHGRQLTPLPNLAWQMDLKYVDCGADGTAYLINIVDCCASEWVAKEFGKYCGAEEALACLERATLARFPRTGKATHTKLRSDNGPQFKARRFREGARALGFLHERTPKECPEADGVIESLHAGLERDYLRVMVFDSFEEAREYIDWAFEDYNKVKPMQRLGWLTPAEYIAKLQEKETNETSTLEARDSVQA